jgi:hypothetical protein
MRDAVMAGRKCYTRKLRESRFRQRPMMFLNLESATIDYFDSMILPWAEAIRRSLHVPTMVLHAAPKEPG